MSRYSDPMMGSFAGQSVNITQSHHEANRNSLPDVKRTGEVEDALHNLNAAIQRLKHHSHLLPERLHSVLSPEMPRPEQAKEAAPYTASLPHSIDHLRREIVSIADSLESINHRIAL